MSLSMMFVPLTAWVMMKVRPPRAWWECLSIAVVGLGLLSLHMPIAFHPQPGLVFFADGAGAVDLVLLHQPLRVKYR